MRRRHRRRQGAAIVEFGIAFPVFVLVMFGMFEFGRAFMVAQMVNAACRVGARQGVVDGVSTAEVITVMRDVLTNAGVADSRIYVIDGSPFDEEPFEDHDLQDMIDDYPATEIELAEANPRQLAIIRIEVDYDDVALITPMWLEGVMLRGQLVVRHE